MSFFKKILSEIKGNEDLSEIKSSSFRDFLNGNMFTKKFFRKQIPLIFMIFILLFFYVDNRFYCEKKLLNILELEKKIKDIKFESLTISAQLMRLTRQSNINQLIKDRGIDLEVSKKPAIVIDTTETVSITNSESKQPENKNDKNSQ